MSRWPSVLCRIALCCTCAALHLCCTALQQDGSTPELFNDVLQAVLQCCCPQPGTTPRFQRVRPKHSFGASTGNGDDNDDDDDDDDDNVDDDDDEEDDGGSNGKGQDGAFSPRVSLPPSAQKLANALTAAGLPANEEQREVARRRSLQAADSSRPLQLHEDDEGQGGYEDDEEGVAGQEHQHHQQQQRHHHHQQLQPHHEPHERQHQQQQQTQLDDYQYHGEDQLGAAQALGAHGLRRPSDGVRESLDYLLQIAGAARE